MILLSLYSLKIMYRFMFHFTCLTYLVKHTLILVFEEKLYVLNSDYVLRSTAYKLCHTDQKSVFENVISFLCVH